MNLLRGWLGEKKTAFHLWLSLTRKTYPRFHNIIIPSKNGTTQIDHLIISVYGIFIVETKNKKGWIFGAEKQPKWTQTLYRKKYTFPNPLRQVYRQKKVLTEFLSLDESCIKTLIYFVGDSEFRTQLPENVIDSGLGHFIKKFRTELLSKGEVQRLTIKLKNFLSQSTLTKKNHLESLRKRHLSDSFCPNCGSRLTMRAARRGPKTGQNFLACKNFPRCRFTKKV